MLSFPFFVQADIYRFCNNKRIQPIRILSIFMNFHMRTVTALHRTTGTNHILQLSSIFFCISIAYLGIDEDLFNVEVDSPSAVKIDVVQANSDKAKTRSCRGVCLKIIAHFELHFKLFKAISWGFQVYFPLDNETANG